MHNSDVRPPTLRLAAAAISRPAPHGTRALSVADPGRW
jgi:hypothetical protein